MSLLLRHNAMATAKPQSKAAITVAMMIILNKNHAYQHCFFYGMIRFRIIK